MSVLPSSGVSRDFIFFPYSISFNLASEKSCTNSKFLGVNRSDKKGIMLPLVLVVSNDVL